MEPVDDGMARKKERISTEGGRRLSADNPFAGLSADGLKEGPPSPSPAPASRAERRQAGKGRRGPLLLRKLKAGKGGKTVTEVSGFPGGMEEARRLLPELRTSLGTGGTSKDAVIELQGECRERLRPVLERKGYHVKG